MRRQGRGGFGPVWLGAVAALAACLGAGAGAAESGPVEPDRVSVAFDDAARTATITIATPGGELRWSDLLRGLARAKGFDDAALDGLLPDTAVDLDAFGVPLAVIGLGRAIGRDVGLAMHREAGSVTRVEIALSERALFESQRRLKRRVRDAARGLWPTFRVDPPPRRGLVLPEGWADAAADAGGLVIVVHGLHSDADQHAAFMDELRGLGHAVGVFVYANDAPIADAGRRLADALRGLERDHRGLRVALVTWSMGGLVARYAIEVEEPFVVNVDRLIMVGPPTHGSSLARFAFGLEVVEHVDKLDLADPVERLFHAIEDGLGEAYADLTPGSDLLRELDARPRRDDVAYSLLLGTAAPFRPGVVDGVRRRVRASGESNRFVRFFGPKVDQWLADLDELVAGRGDGAVAVERGRLEGVDDVVLLPFDHRTALTGPSRPGVETELRQAIIDRLDAWRGAP